MRAQIDMADVAIAETVKGGGAYKAKEKLTVEEYLDFIDSDKQLDLPVVHLREIIYIQGFRRLGKITKKILLEAVASLELMNPRRSTLQDGIVSPYVPLTVEEVIKDLEDLKWQECCVTSLLTFNGDNRESSQVHFHSSEVSAPSPVTPKRAKKKKRKLSSTVDSTTSDTTGQSSCADT